MRVLTLPVGDNKIVDDISAEIQAIYYTSGILSNIYHITKNKNENAQLNMIVTSFVPESSPYWFFYYLWPPYIITFDFNEGVIIFSVKTESSLYTSCMEFIYAINIWDDRILLEDRDGEIIYASCNRKEYHSQLLFLSPNDSMIGGVVSYEYYHGDPAECRNTRSDRYNFPRI
ncbi:MAG: hypothetical protein AB1656_25405 [Candidatus Omnitrophota bacterium]